MLASFFTILVGLATTTWALPSVNRELLSRSESHSVEVIPSQSSPSSSDTVSSRTNAHPAHPYSSIKGTPPRKARRSSTVLCSAGSLGSRTSTERTAGRPALIAASWSSPSSTRVAVTVTRRIPPTIRFSQKVITSCKSHSPADPYCTG